MGFQPPREMVSFLLLVTIHLWKDSGLFTVSSMSVIVLLKMAARCFELVMFDDITWWYTI